jgi:hypothetical protein
VLYCDDKIATQIKHAPLQRGVKRTAGFVAAKPTVFVGATFRVARKATAIPDTNACYLHLMDGRGKPRPYNDPSKIMTNQNTVGATFRVARKAVT